MKIYLGLGTNLGDKEQNLLTAVRLINERIGKVVSLSAFLATEPWGFASDNSFLNAACCVQVEATRSVFDVLDTTQQIEREMGRTHKSAGRQYSDRIIDIDLLMAFAPDGASITIDIPRLQLPHPLIGQRDFVKIPLAEILETNL